MASYASARHSPTIDLSDVGAEAGSLESDAEAARRRLYFGEALSAAIAYGGLDGELLASPEALFDCLSEAYDPHFTGDAAYSKEDFALFFLSCVYDLLEVEEARSTLRLGAVRYLEEKKTHLSQDLAALGGGSSSDPYGADGAGPAGEVAGAADQRNFVLAYDSLKMELGKSREPGPRQDNDIHRAPSAEDLTPGTDHGELARLRARRHRAVAEMQKAERRRKAKALAGVASLCSAAVLAAMVFVTR